MATCLPEAAAHPDKIFKTSARLLGAELVDGHTMAAEDGVSLNVLLGQLIRKEKARRERARQQAASRTVEACMLPGFDNPTDHSPQHQLNASDRQELPTRRSAAPSLARPSRTRSAA
ncbi:hypothetical protein GCM10009733_021630 [Nonomuraea maheshkhaliensis]|uniref:Transposase n=1 Tax=Nonomuraea maheshkhaliensis TaxID=419590 RepID=A0ABN2F067_9ACTN